MTGQLTGFESEDLTTHNVLECHASIFTDLLIYFEMNFYLYMYVVNPLYVTFEYIRPICFLDLPLNLSFRNH